MLCLRAFLLIEFVLHIFFSLLLSFLIHFINSSEFDSLFCKSVSVRGDGYSWDMAVANELGILWVAFGNNPYIRVCVCIAFVVTDSCWPIWLMNVVVICVKSNVGRSLSLSFSGVHWMPAQLCRRLLELVENVLLNHTIFDINENSQIQYAFPKNLHTLFVFFSFYSVCAFRNKTRKKSIRRMLGEAFYNWNFCVIYDKTLVNFRENVFVSANFEHTYCAWHMLQGKVEYKEATISCQISVVARRVSVLLWKELIGWNNAHSGTGKSIFASELLCSLPKCHFKKACQLLSICTAIINFV